MTAFNILAIDKATPKGRVPPAGTGYNAPVTLNAATGNEVAFTVAYTVNKATSGNDTGLLVSMTDTASPGTSLLLDLKRNSTSVLRVNGAGAVFLANYISDDFDGISYRMGEGYTPFNLASGSSIGWSSGSASAGTLDLYISRDAANVLALRNGVNANTLRVYTTYTDASNRENLAITGSAITVETAGTGTDNIDLTLTPAGTGVLKFGTHSAWTAEVISGYITIKDSGGTSRKIAVIS